MRHFWRNEALLQGNMHILKTSRFDLFFLFLIMPN